ncbi:MAG: response regulator transcription factor [Desulfobacteraceae bacterium]
MAKEKILIVDDEEDILELVRYNLSKEGYQTICASTGEEALKINSEQQPDLIVLDLMLPGIDGLEVTKNIRNSNGEKGTPIVMLTARGEEADIVTGLELGANDYISKPFSPRELIARIRAILRRRGNNRDKQESHIIREGGLTIDHRRHLVTLSGEQIDLTYSEFQLLSLIAAKKGWVFTRGQLVDSIHGENYAVTERSIDVIVVGLRKKMGDHGNLIETVRGIGYRFKDTFND